MAMFISFHMELFAQGKHKLLEYHACPDFHQSTEYIRIEECNDDHSHGKNNPLYSSSSERC